MHTDIIDISTTTEIVWCFFSVYSFIWEDKWNNTAQILGSNIFLMLSFHMFSLDLSWWYFTFRKTCELSTYSFSISQTSSQTKNLFSSLRDSDRIRARKVNCFLQVACMEQRKSTPVFHVLYIFCPCWECGCEQQRKKHLIKVYLLKMKGSNLGISMIIFQQKDDRSCTQGGTGWKASSFLSFSKKQVRGMKDAEQKIKLW